MVPPPPGSQPRCGNPACGRPIERQATGRPARYCSGSCRQAARRERLSLAETERQRAGRLGADPAVPGQYRSATQAAALPARDHAAYQAAPIPRQVAGAMAPLVTKQLIVRDGRQVFPGGEAGHPTSMPVIRDAVDGPDAPAGSGTRGAASMATLGVDARLSGRRLDDSPAGTVVRAGVPEVQRLHQAGQNRRCRRRPTVGWRGRPFPRR